MSGIAGLIYFNGRPVGRETVTAMGDKLTHRGGDSSGEWMDGNVDLLQRTLWTTPESLSEKFPILSQDGKSVLVADARVDNREELFSLLGIAGGLQVGDGELILRAYEKWGERCPEKLLGDFAFVLWDSRRRIFFCARDPFGIKPFYYHRSENFFAFASEMKGLHCLDEIPRTLNEFKIAEYLANSFEDKEMTFYQGIRRLPPAHMLTVSQEKTTLRSYWSLDPERKIRFKSDDDYAEAFRRIFTEAVRCRLRSAFPVGSFLSGGLDSSSIVCVARNLLAAEDKKLHTFSAIFPDVPQSDEQPFIQAVLAQNGIASSFIRADQHAPLGSLQQVYDQHDQPFFSPNFFIQRSLYGAAQQQKIRVLLDGTDGDSVVCHGMGYLPELFSHGHWIRFWKEAEAFARHSNRPMTNILWHRGVKPWIPEEARRIWRIIHGRSPFLGDQLINLSFSRRISCRETFRKRQSELCRSSRTSQGDHWIGLNSGLTSYMMEVADLLSGYSSLEPRYPFYDRRLVEFCFALPPDQKLRNGWTRYIERTSMAGILPEEIQWRTSKSNLGPNFVHGLVSFERETLKETLDDALSSISDYIHVKNAREVYQRFITRPDASNSMALWVIVTLSVWLTGMKNDKEVFG